MFDINYKNLKNNSKIVLAETSHLHLCAINIFVKIGAIHEEENERGMAHMLEHLLLKRVTSQKNKDPLVRYLISRGVYFNAETTMEFTRYYMTDILPEYLHKALEFMYEIIYAPIFTEKEFLEEREIIISELEDKKSSPHYKMREAYRKYFFVNHPLSREIGGDIKQVKNTSYKELQNFYKKYYLPQNIVISVAGKGIRNNKKINEILNNFDSKKSLQKNLISQPQKFVPPKEKEFQFQLDFEKTVSLQYYFSIPERKALSLREQACFSIIDYIMGGSPFSRLSMNLREKHRMVYGASSTRFFLYSHGEFIIATSFQEKHLEKIVKEISREIRKFRDTNISKKELEEAISATKIQHYDMMDKVNSIAFDNCFFLSLDNSKASPEDFINEAEKATPEMIKKYAQKYFVKENCYIFVNYKKKLKNLDLDI